MKKALLVVFVMLRVNQFSNAQCTTSNATGCDCKDGSTNCDLLPNITLAEEPLMASGNNGVIEYSQTGNGVENGRLRVSVSTPNTGYGPLTVRSSSIFLCGTDTFYSNPGTCPSGGSPRNLTFQRIYHKNGNTMTYYDRPAGSMTYHPTHGHMHVDDWGIYTLRIRDTAQADPLQWPIIGAGAKLGFCLMDYGTCSYYAGHCEDTAGNTMLNGDFPNYALGGGNYNCSPSEQGISSGYTDIYYQYLDGMYITLPPTTCNGDYYIVVQIDPWNYFLEESENDNVIAVPYTLSKQLPAGTGSATITASVSTGNICEGESLQLTANAGSTYLWSTNETTQSITVSQPGNYTVQVTSLCGMATSQPLTVSVTPSHMITATDAAVCEGTPITLSASATGVVNWYATDTSSGSFYTGDTYTATIAGTTTFYVASHDTIFGASGSVGPPDNTIGNGAYYNNDQHEIFNVTKACILKSVKVYCGSQKSRTIQLRDNGGNVLQQLVTTIDTGMHVINLNWLIQPGTSYQLGWASGSQPNWFRNSSGASYPYTFGSIISVTGNSANDPVRWYGYYDWKVEEAPVVCASPAQPVVATINPEPTTTLSGLNAQYYNTDAPVTLTGTPAGGTFNGTGVNGNTFNPAAAGVGGPYDITYTYTDSATTCTGSSIVQVTVLEDVGTGVENIEGISGVNIFPNPNNGQFVLTLKSKGSRTIDISIKNILGEKIVEDRELAVSDVYLHAVNLSNAAKGIYTLTISSGNKMNAYRVVVK